MNFSNTLEKRINLKRYDLTSHLKQEMILNMLPPLCLLLSFQHFFPEGKTHEISRIIFAAT
jgi:hypothetical protein